MIYRIDLYALMCLRNEEKYIQVEIIIYRVKHLLMLGMKRSHGFVYFRQNSPSMIFSLEKPNNMEDMCLRVRVHADRH